jgi:hypothetical protein
MCPKIDVMEREYKKLEFGVHLKGLVKMLWNTSIEFSLTKQNKNNVCTTRGPTALTHFENEQGIAWADFGTLLDMYYINAQAQNHDSHVIHASLFSVLVKTNIMM